MIILKEGRDQRGWAKEYDCTGQGHGFGGCDARLLVEEKDLFATKSCDYVGDCDWTVTFRCAWCGILTDILSTPFSPSSLPSYQKWQQEGSDT